MLQNTSKKRIVWLLFIYYILCRSIYGSVPESDTQISYFLQNRQFTSAIVAYQNYAYLIKQHDPVIIEKIATAILEEGMENTDITKKIAAYYSMIACAYVPNLYRLESAIRMQHPQLQASAIYLLSKHTGDRSEEILKYGLISPFPIIQLTTAYVLAQKKFPKACTFIESLLHKLPSVLHIYFPEFFAILNTAESRRKVVHFMNHKEEKIRIHAIISAMQYRIEEALPYIQAMLTHASPLEQEACLFALSHMNDIACLPRMKSLVASNCEEVSLASSFALYTLGYHEYYTVITDLAEKENPFAIALLKFIPEASECLYKLLKSPNFILRMNAAISLLQLRDNRCIPVIMEILQASMQGVTLCRVSSQGSCMQYIKPLAKLTKMDEEQQTRTKQSSQEIIENILLQTNELSESDFLSIAHFLFESNYSSLIPLSVQLLENLQTPKATLLLESGISRLGSPLIRGYCQVALFKLGKYSLSTSFHQFLEKSLKENLMNYEEIRGEKNIGIFTLQAEEKLRLVLTSMQVISSHSCQSSIDILLQFIVNSHELNRYVLAGLLLNCIQ